MLSLTGHRGVLNPGDIFSHRDPASRPASSASPQMEHMGFREKSHSCTGCFRWKVKESQQSLFALWNPLEDEFLFSYQLPKTALSLIVGSPGKICVLSLQLWVFLKPHRKDLIVFFFFFFPGKTLNIFISHLCLGPNEEKTGAEGKEGGEVREVRFKTSNHSQKIKDIW